MIHPPARSAADFAWRRARPGRHVLMLLVLLFILPSATVSLAAGDAGAPAEDSVGEEGEDRSAPTGSPDNEGRVDLLTQEEFWPYRISLTESWNAGDSSERSLREGSTGVLIRLEEDGRARVDFGRYGLHRVPVDRTDLRERVDAVRSGEVEKEAPNFINAMGSRLVDPSTTPPSMFGWRRAFEYEDSLFLCVYVDASSFEKELESLAARLGPVVKDRPGLLTIVFPIGQRSDVVIGTLLRDSDLQAVYLPDHLSDAYAQTLAGPDLTLPSLQLTSDEGRVLVQGGLTESVLSAVADRLAD